MNGLAQIGVRGLHNLATLLYNSEINMKNGRPLQISLIIGTCAGSVRISYQYKYLWLVLYCFGDMGCQSYNFLGIFGLPCSI